MSHESKLFETIMFTLLLIWFITIPAIVVYFGSHLLERLDRLENLLNRNGKRSATIEQPTIDQSVTNSAEH